MKMLLSAALLTLLAPTARAAAATTRFAYRTAAPEKLVLADEMGGTVKVIRWKDVLDLVWSPDAEALVMTMPAAADSRPEAGPHRVIVAVSADGEDSTVIPDRGDVMSVGWDAPRQKMIVVSGGDVAEVGAVLGEDEDFEWSRRCKKASSTAYGWIQPSPDGARWAFTGILAKTSEVGFYLSPAECGAPARPLDARTPGRFEWSPDGKYLVFVDAKTHAIVIVNVNSGKRRELKQEWFLAAAWTDDGRLLASWAGKKANPIGIVDPAGGKTVVLVADSTPPATVLAWRHPAKKKKAAK